MNDGWWDVVRSVSSVCGVSGIVCSAESVV